MEWTSAAAERIRTLGGSENVDESVERIVERLLVGVSSVPTDLNRVMSALGVVALEEDPELFVPGELRKRDGKLVVALLPGTSKGRRRFTIAHELGHAVFESTGRGRPRTGEELERLCDKLAAAILMPRESFRRVVGNQISLAPLLQASRAFEVSRTSACVRAAELYRAKFLEVENGAIVQRISISPSLASDAFPALASAIRIAESGCDGECEVFLGSRQMRWRVQWRVLSTSSKRALFMLYAA